MKNINMTQLIEFKNHKKEILRGLFEKANSKIGVIFIHGFERTTVEAKFKNIYDALRGKVNTFRFDFSGGGLSDGSFLDTSFEKWSKDLEAAIAVFKKSNPKIQHVHIVAHSVAACIAVSLATHKLIEKIVFLAPAFNQKDLLRYWFVKSSNKEKTITWENFSESLDEAKFQADLKQKKRLTKTHYLGGLYHRSAAGLDFQDKLFPLDTKRFLLVHGDKDGSVPPESNHHLPSGLKTIFVKGGDHDLERPDMSVQYLKKCVGFLLK